MEAMKWDMGGAGAVAGEGVRSAALSLRSGTGGGVGTFEGSATRGGAGVGERGCAITGGALRGAGVARGAGRLGATRSGRAGSARGGAGVACTGGNAGAAALASTLLRGAICTASVSVARVCCPSERSCGTASQSAATCTRIDRTTAM